MGFYLIFGLIAYDTKYGKIWENMENLKKKSAMLPGDYGRILHAWAATAGLKLIGINIFLYDINALFNAEIHLNRLK